MNAPESAQVLLKPLYDRKRKSEASVRTKTNVRMMKKQIDMFKMYNNKKNIITVVENNERVVLENEKEFFSKDCENNNGIMFDEVYRNMTMKEIFLSVFSDFFDLILHYTNINIKFKMLSEKHKNVIKRWNSELFEDKFIDVDINAEFDEECEKCEKQMTAEDKQLMYEIVKVLTPTLDFTDIDKKDSGNEVRLISKEEFHSYLGICIIMACMYDSKVPLDFLFSKSGNEIYRMTMSLKRFRFIRKYIIFHDIRIDKAFKEIIEEAKQKIPKEDLEFIMNENNIDINRIFETIDIRKRKEMDNQTKENEVKPALGKNNGENPFVKDQSDANVPLKFDKNVYFKHSQNIEEMLCVQLDTVVNKIKMGFLTYLERKGNKAKVDKDTLNKFIECLVEDVKNVKTLIRNEYKRINDDCIKNEITDLSKWFTSTEGYKVSEELIEIFNNVYSKLKPNNNKPSTSTKSTYVTEIENRIYDIVNVTLPNIYELIKEEFMTFDTYVKTMNKCGKTIKDFLHDDFDMVFDLYDKNSDNYYLIESMENCFNQCLHNTAVNKYGSKMAIDEGLCYTACITKFLQCIARKPACQGLLSYCLCDSQSPYIYYNHFYRGKSINNVGNVGPKIVNELLAQTEFVWKDRNDGITPTIYTDSFFSNTYLCADISINKKMNVICTASKKNAEIPEVVKDFSGLSNGDFRIFDICGCNLKYIQVKDFSKDLIIITSVNDCNSIISCIKKSFSSKDYDYYEKEVSVAQKTYMYGMRGVDTMDYCTKVISVRRRTPRWTCVEFEHLFDMSLVNTFTIYNYWHKKKCEESGKPITSLKRRMETLRLGLDLCMEWVNKRFSKRINNLMNSAVFRNKLRESSTLFDVQKVYIEYKVSLQKASQKRCCVCYRLNKGKRKTWNFCYHCGCPMCDVHSGFDGRCYKCMQFNSSQMSSLTDYYYDLTVAKKATFGQVPMDSYNTLFSNSDGNLNESTSTTIICRSKSDILDYSSIAASDVFGSYFEGLHVNASFNTSTKSMEIESSMRSSFDGMPPPVIPSEKGRVNNPIGTSNLK